MKTTLTLLALATLALSACENTWWGAGQDTQNLGHEMKKSSGVNN